MRWFLFLVLVFAGLWYLRGIEEKPPPKIEDSFIGGPVKSLHKAEAFEESYLESVEARNQRMEEQLEKDSGGTNQH